MCFSLKASLAASFVLLVMSVLCIRKFRNSSKFLIALIPLFFSIQQAAEAGVWASFDYELGLMWRLVFSYIFLFFAMVVWPFWMPFALYRAERVAYRRIILSYLLVLGLIISLILAVYVAFSELEVMAVCSHIVYYMPKLFNLSDEILLGVYTLPTILPFFVSSVKKSKLFGACVAISLFYTIYAYNYALTSVWCYFAALLSAFIYLVF